MRVLVKVLVVLAAIAVSAMAGYIVPASTAQVVGNVEFDREKFIASFKEELKTALDAQAQDDAMLQRLEKVQTQIVEKEMTAGDVFYVNLDTYVVMTPDEMNDLKQVYVENPEKEPVVVSQMILNDEETFDLAELDQIPLGAVSEAVDEGMDSAAEVGLVEEASSEDTGSDAAAAVEDNTPGAVVKDDWVQNQIDANKDQIDDTDLAVGAEIYNSLDTEYLFNLAEDGLTEEEKVQVNEYLRSNLTDEQYETAKTLYYKYVDLLE